MIAYNLQGSLRRFCLFVSHQLKAFAVDQSQDAVKLTEENAVRYSIYSTSQYLNVFINELNLKKKIC